MAWVDIPLVATGEIIASTYGNQIRGDLAVLKTHTHDGTTGGGGTLPAKNEFIPCDASRNGHTSYTIASALDLNGMSVQAMTDGAKKQLAFTGIFTGTPTAVNLIVSAAGTGNMAWFTLARWSLLTQSEGTVTDSQGTDGSPQITALTNGIVTAIALIGSFTGAVAGDVWSLNFIRDGDDASDTVGVSVFGIGLQIVY